MKGTADTWKHVILVVAILAVAACQEGPRPVDSTQNTVAPGPSKQDMSGAGQGVELEQEVVVGLHREPNELVVNALADAGMLLKPLTQIVPYDVDSTGRFELVAVNIGSGVVKRRFVLLERKVTGRYRIHSQSEGYLGFDTTTVLKRSGSRRVLEIKEVRFDRKGNEHIRRGQLVWDMQ